MAGDRSARVGSGTPFAPSRRLRVAFIVSPFGIIEYPNLAASLLKAEAQHAGFRCDVHYGSLEFARRIGWAGYLTCYYTDPYLLLGERIFAPTIFGDAIPSWGQYWEQVVRPYDEPTWSFFRPPEYFGRNRRAFERMQDDAAAFVAEYVARPELDDYDVFAFTTSYGQNVAALSIAKRLKARRPDVPIIFGGANCQGVMGEQLVRSFPFVDYACTTEGDVAFPAFLDAIERGVPVAVPGIVGRESDGTVACAGAPPMVLDLDALPFPDYSDFFEQFHFRGPEYAASLAIPMEASRGCWWGQKHHCTFCGLNGETMRYRSKSPRRVVAEIDHLVDSFGAKKIMMTDNILHNRSITELLPLLTPPRAELFFEVKGNLDRSDLEALLAAGIRHVQPGIESLSTRLLRDMAKGTDSFQNLQLLKWGKEVGMELSWNVLCGFPTERDEDYADLARLIPMIHHLMPPRGFGQISVDRFSPMFNDPKRFGMEIEPFPAYGYVYPLGAEDIRQLAYAFRFTSARSSTAISMAPPPYARRAYEAYLIWRNFFFRVDFSFTVDGVGCVQVHDTRTVSDDEERCLDRRASRIFLALDSAQTVASTGRLLARDGDPVAEEEIRATLADFQRWNYLYVEGDKYLVLANRRRDEVAGLGHAVEPYDEAAVR